MLLYVLQALRAAYERPSTTSFEVVLREAEAAEHTAGTSSTGTWGSVAYGKAAAPASADGNAGGVAPGGTCTALLRRPAVFTLAVVWESPKVGMKLIALPTEVSM